VTVLGERPGAGAIAGLLLIIAGSWLSTDGRVPPGPTATLAMLLRRRRRAREGRPGAAAGGGAPDAGRQPSSTTIRITTTTITMPTPAGTMGR
jgi:hypothetical protein